MVNLTEEVFIFEHLDPDGGYASGIDNVIIAMATEVHDTKWVIVGVTNNPELQLGKIVKHPKIKNIDFLPVARINKRKFSKNKRIPHSLIYAIGLVRFRSKIRSKVIHSHRIEIGFLVVIFWPKSVLIQFIHNARNNLLGTQSDSKWKNFQRLFALIESLVLKKAKKILIFNEDEFQRISEIRNSVVRCFTWYDSNIFNVRRSKVRDSTKIIAAWIGRLDRQKNPELIIDIAIELKKNFVPFEVNIFGSGVLEGLVRQLVTENDLQSNIILHGVVSKEILAEKLQDSDLLLMTSVYEGSPTTLVEALACGVPVVCTSGSDPDGIIANGINGFRLEQWNAESFTECITKTVVLSSEATSNTVLNRTASIQVPKLAHESLG